jgi:sugar O-acyltransferase (sialic acid O-acetyltransferase NeuD family)
MKRSVVLIAASGLAREVAAAVRAAGTYEIIAVLDDNTSLHGMDCAGVAIAGDLDTAADLGDVQFVICAGSGGARRRIADRLAARGIGSTRYATVVHPMASVSASCLIGAGSVVLANVTMTADVTVGDHVVLMPHVVLTHDNVVADYATLCAGVVLGGTVRIGPGAYLGMNSSVRQGLRVGRDATLGMGSVLLQDLPPEQIWTGIPAHPMTARSVAPLALVHDINGPRAAVSDSERLDAR